jgi:hypothetical protein
MKTKTSSKKVPTPFSRRIALLGSALLALSIFAPAVVEAVPITLSLDNPSQSVVRPSSGTVTLNFTGTVMIEPGFAFHGIQDVILDFPFNASGSHFLDRVFGDAFLPFVQDHQASTGNFTGGTFIGTLFTINVTPEDPLGLYAFVGGGPPNLPSEVFLRVADENNENMTVAREAFSVLVTGVPDRGSSILLLGLSLAALYSVQRAFVSRAKGVRAGRL